jgi:hypothetical protein
VEIVVERVNVTSRHCRFNHGHDARGAFEAANEKFVAENEIKKERKDGSDKI